MITNTANKVIYTGDGNTKQFLISFPFGDISEINLFLHNISTGEDEIILSNWSYDNATGYITYPVSGSAMASTHQIVVIRQTPLTQEKDHTVRLFTSEDIENISDKLTREIQDISEKVDRSIKFPASISSGETDAKSYIDTINAKVATATAQATIATTQAGLATTAKNAAETAQDKAEKWAEGTDAEVEALGGTHSAKNWANVAQAAAESEAVQTVAENIEDVNTVAGIQSDVTQVASIAAAVSNVSDHDTEVNTVYDNLSSVITTATNINDVNAVAGIKNDVVAVSNIKANVTSVAGNASNINAVAANSTNITTVANDKTNIDTVAGNTTNINTVATNAADINTVAADITKITSVADDLTNIEAVADNETNINTVATNISDVSSVAADSTNINAVAADLTNIDAVNSNATNINTVATNISDVNATGQAIEDVSAVADNLSDITLVANDLENIDEVATNVAQWQKPADWVDIRSGAVAESFTILTGHTADYSAYDYVAFAPTISNTSNTYSVFIDGLYYNSYTSGTTFELRWSTSGITSGWDVTYPEALRTHTIRFTPDNASDHFTAITGARPTGTATNVNYAYGTLWAHFTTVNEISVEYLFSRYASQYYNPNIEAVTAIGDTLVVSGIRGFLGKGLDVWNTATSGSKRLSYLPKIDYNGPTINSTGAFNCSSQYVGTLKEIRLANGNASSSEGTAGALFANLKALKKITCDNWRMAGFGSRVFANCSALEKLPPFVTNYGNTSVNITDILLGCTGLKDTVINVTRANENQPINYFRCGGSSSNRLDGVKGVLFNQNMTSLTGASPQINVSYTGMNRQALVNMFKSMPYNVGYTVVGSPTITNGVMSDIVGGSVLQGAAYVKTDSVVNLDKGFSTSVYFTMPASGNNFALYSRNSGSTGGVALICPYNATYRIVFYNSSHQSAYDKSISTGTVTLQFNTSYIFKLDCSGGENSAKTFTLQLRNAADTETLFTYTDTTEAFSFGNCGFSYGVSLSDQAYVPFSGSINLTKSPTFANGVPWFTGAAAMTKTCSVVGCTGTADLTAEDKAIATDKGWALTLS